jgi:ABC-type polysaccharide/polyol phosphate export permease
MRQNWNLLLVFIKTDFVIRYQNSVLGFLWVFLKPFLIFGVLFFVFQFFKADVLHFSSYLLLGLILFQFFADGTLFGTNSLLARAPILSRMKISPTITVLSSVFGATIHFVFALIVFFVFCVFQNIFASIFELFLFSVLVISEFLLILGISFLTSVLIIKFRDWHQIWEIFLTILFYATPIFYPLEILSPSVRSIIEINPLTPIIIFSRDLLIYNKMIPWQGLLSLFLVTVIFCVFSFFVFKNNVQQAIEKL